MSTGTGTLQRPSGVIIEPKRFSRLRLLRLWTMDMYIIRCFVGAYLVCAVSFIGFYAVVEAFFKLHKFIPSGASSPLEVVGTMFHSLFRYNMAMIPTIYVNYMGPILTLAAAMFALTFLNRGNEFTAIKASGISVYRIVVPIFILGACCSGLTFLCQEWVLPQLREPIRDALAISRSGSLRPDSFYDSVHDLHIQVKRYHPVTKIAEGVNVRRWSLSHKESVSREKLIIDALQMHWIPLPSSPGEQERGRWVLRDGSIQRWDGRGELVLNSGEEGFEQLKRPFREYQLETSLLPIDLETSDQDISYLSWKELEAQHRRQPEQRHLLVKLHHHSAFPLSHVILLFLGIPFVVNFESRSFVLGLAVCFSLCAGYFLLSSMAMSLASDSGDAVVPPVLAAWLPNILFGSLGLTIFTNMRS